MQDDDGADAALTEAFVLLDPTRAQIVRMERVVGSRLARLRRPLWSEWIDMFRLQPIRSTALVFAASGMVLFTTPLGGLLSGVLRRALS